MKRYAIFGVFWLLLILGAPPVAADAPPLRVFVSVLPQQTFAERVGGAHVQVQTLVPPGSSPESFTPTPRQVAALAEADLYLRIGMPFEEAWMERIRATNPRMAILDLREGLPLRRMEAHHHEGGHHEQTHESHQGEALDPHLWTSPRLVQGMAAAIRDRLTALDPAHGAEYATNYQGFVAELQQLDTEIGELLHGVEGRSFLVFHPAWGYFADAYGLQQIAIEREGKEPGAKALAEVIASARTSGAKVIFMQPQSDPRLARQVAANIGGQVATIDPLAADYIPNLRRAAQAIAEAAR
jgi:zinc transport system substrate-binding protein